MLKISTEKFKDAIGRLYSWRCSRENNTFYDHLFSAIGAAEYENKLRISAVFQEYAMAYAEWKQIGNSIFIKYGVTDNVDSCV